MIGVHHHLEPARCLDPLTVHGLADRINRGGPGLGNGLRPHSKPDERCFHRIIGHFVALFGEIRPHSDKGVVFP
jgi:hypothetical protein